MDFRILHYLLEFCSNSCPLPWRRKWQPTPVFLPWECHGQRSLAGSMGLQRVGHNWATILMTIDSVMPSNHLIFLHPLFLLPSIFLSVFSNESTLQIRWLKYRSFSFSISPSNEYSGLISFLIDWFNLLAVQRTLKSLQHHSLKASILWCSAFFIVQLSHL